MSRRCHVRRGAARIGPGLCALLMSALAAADPPRNLALGRKVVFAPAPNYSLTARGGTDAADLTDGKLSDRKDEKIWFDSKAVGYSYAGVVQLAVDLGAAANVGEVAVRFQGGSPQAGITLPCWVHVLASADGSRYHRVASYSNWEPRDAARFALPRAEGKPWLHWLRFRGVNVRARYVGLELYGAGLSVADELRVLEGPPDATYRKCEDGTPSAFSVTGPRVYFHKPVVPVPRAVYVHPPLRLVPRASAPTPIGWIVPPGCEKLRVTATLDLPKDLHFLGGRFGGTDLAKAKPEPLDEDYDRYTFTFTAGKGNKAWRRVYVYSDYLHLQRTKSRRKLKDAIRHQLRWEGGGAGLVEQPIRRFCISGMPPERRPKRLMTCLGWWSLSDTMAWPDAAQTWSYLGLNTVPLFARWTKLDDPNVVRTLEAFRKAGFKVMNIDSTFHHMVARAGRRKGELMCQLGGGKVGTRLCPSYRGPLYRAEIDRLARESARVKADYISCDIELWGWRGPVDAAKCTRCRKDFAESGAKDWPAWQLAKGEEIWRDVATAVRAAYARAGLPPPELGVYDFRPGQSYQNFWPFDRLYPKLMTNSQVSTYTPLEPYHLELIGDEARADRAKLPTSDVLPWITPGDAGTFPPRQLTWAVLECFANGARGVHFWSGRLWDGETLAGYARAIRIAARVEDVIVDGQLVRGVRCEPPARVSGMRRGEEMFLLIADYRSPRARALTVLLPDTKARAVVDLETGKEMAQLAAGAGRFRLEVPAWSARALYVKPK